MDWEDDAPYMAWLDGAQTPFFFLHSAGLGITGEDLPELKPVGSVETVAGSGRRLYVGPDDLTAGSYRVTVGVFRRGVTRDEQSLLLRDVQRAAVQTRAILKGGRTLPIARFSSVKTTRRAAVALGAEVDVSFEPALPYWFDPPRTISVTPGTPQTVWVGGDADAALGVRITAGAQAITDPQVRSDAGLTTWKGTVGAGQTLVLTPGAAVLGGQDASVRLLGPDPLLRPGDRALLVTAPGATVDIEYREGWLL